MNASEYKSYSIYIDNETVSMSVYLGKDDNGEVKRNLIFKSPRSPRVANMLADIFYDILKNN